MKYGDLPKTQGACLYFIAGHELLHGLEQIERYALLTFEVVQLFGPCEDPRGQAFFDNDRPSAVLRLIHYRIVFAFMPNEGSEGWRPMQYCCICKMENIVKPIPVWVKDVVRQWISDEDAIHAKVAARTLAPLIDGDLKTVRKPLILGEAGIKIR